MLSETLCFAKDTHKVATSPLATVHSFLSMYNRHCRQQRQITAPLSIGGVSSDSLPLQRVTFGIISCAVIDDLENCCKSYSHILTLNSLTSSEISTTNGH